MKDFVSVCLVAAGLIAALAMVQAQPPAPPPVRNFAEFPPSHGTQTVLFLDFTDGDTFKIAFLTTEKIRVFGIDSPEKNTEAGRAAKLFAEGLAKPGQLLNVTLRGREKYGRLLGSVELPDGRDLAEVLIEAKQAKPWSGKGAKP